MRNIGLNGLAALAILASSIVSSFAQTQMGGLWYFSKNDDGAVLGWKGSSASEEFAGPVFVCHRKQKSLEISLDLPDDVKAGTKVTASLSRGQSSAIVVSGAAEDGLGGAVISQVVPYTSAQGLLSADGDLMLKRSEKDVYVYPDSKSTLQFRRFLKGCGGKI